MTALAAALENVGFSPSTSEGSTEAASTTPTPFKFVTHQRPDTDAWLCLWLASRVMAKDAPHTFHFVRAGERLPPQEEVGYRVEYFDTGLGYFDQHGRELKRSSSFKLMCEGLLQHKDPGLAPLIELSVATDNIEDVERTSIHYVLKGLALHYQDEETKEIDWEAARILAFTAFDILYGQATERHENRQRYLKKKTEGAVRELNNGLKVANLYYSPSLRDAAFEDGCDVVCYFVNRKRQGGFYPIIQVNRNSKVVLDRVMFAIRQAEAKKRNVPTKGHDLWAVGMNPAFGSWFFHDSHKLLACGTLGHELRHEDEFTKLSINEIMKIVHQEIGSLSSEATGK